MKLNKYISAAVVSAAVLLGMQSCFQDLDQDPAFNYPPEPERPVIDNKDLLLHFDFADNVEDQSDYNFVTSRSGTDTYVDGMDGRAYKGDGTNPYVLINTNPGVGDIGEPDAAVRNLGSFTVAFWINSPKNDGATGIFSVSHPSEFWGNLDVFQENPGSDTEMFLKVHLFSVSGNERKEVWVEARIEDGFDQWMHIAFVYDETTSTIRTYRDGEQVHENVLEGVGAITLQNPGPMVLGTLQFMTQPSLTSATSGEDWARYFTGSLDQFYFYKKALSVAEVQSLYNR